MRIGWKRVMAEIATLKEHIANYSKARKVFDEYRVSGWSKTFRGQHAEELRLRQEAKQALKNEPVELQTVRRNVGQILRMKLPERLRKHERDKSTRHNFFLV